MVVFIARRDPVQSSPSLFFLPANDLWFESRSQTNTNINTNTNTQHQHAFVVPFGSLVLYVVFCYVKDSLLTLSWLSETAKTTIGLMCFKGGSMLKQRLWAACGIGWMTAKTTRPDVLRRWSSVVDGKQCDGAHSTRGVKAAIGSGMSRKPNQEGWCLRFMHVSYRRYRVTRKPNQERPTRPP